MSGKLIMKRKFEKIQEPAINNNNKVEVDKAASTTPSTISKHNKQKSNKKDEALLRETENKRIRCDTPPPEPEDLDLPPFPQANEQNRRLLEAIQLKVLELQNELDAFEHDVEAHEEDFYYLNDPQQHNLPNNQMSEQDAEALGFAMCAQETLLFLQREDIPTDSLLYTRLRDALVGCTQPDCVLHI